MPVKMEVAAPKDRFVAAAIDFVPPFLLFLVFYLVAVPGLATAVALFGSIYLIFRDLVFNGQSPGKRFTNLQVIDADTDRAPDPMALILRNLGFGIPGLNVAYAIVEGVRVIRHPQHLRFGDEFAATGVVQVPAGERAQLLSRTAPDRPSRSGPAATAHGASSAATTPGMVPPPPAKPAPPAKGAAPRPVGQVATGGKPGAMPARPGPEPMTGSGKIVAPGAGSRAPGPALAPRKPPGPIDLPPESPRKPAAPPAARPAPKPGSPGVKLSEDDPLKKLAELASKK